MARTCERVNEPLGSIQCEEFLDKLKTVSFSRTTLLHGVNLYQQQALTYTIQNKVISAARLEVTEGPVALY